MHADLAPRLLACRFVLLNERLSALLVALHLAAQALETRKRLFRGLTLGGKARKRALASGDLIAQARGGAQQLRLPGETLLRLRAQRGGLALLLRCKRFLFFHGALHLAAAAGDGIALGIQCFQPLAQRGKQQIIVIFVALQLEHGVLRRALLPLRDLQLVSRLRKLALGVIGGLGSERQLFCKAAAPRSQLAQLACAAQNACAARDRATRHRAAAVQDLTVKRHDAERVRKPA